MGVSETTGRIQQMLNSPALEGKLFNERFWCSLRGAPKGRRKARGASPSRRGELPSATLCKSTMLQKDNVPHVYAPRYTLTHGCTDDAI